MPLIQSLVIDCELRLCVHVVVLAVLIVILSVCGSPHVCSAIA